MIKIEKGRVEISGLYPNVMADVSTLVHNLYHNICIEHAGMNPEEAKADILRAVNYGFMSKDEVHAKAAKAKEDMLQHPEILLDMLKNILT